MASSDHSILLGKRMGVTASSKVEGLTTLSFALTNCEVESSGISVGLINEECYSQALKVAKGTDGTRLRQTFSFQTFMIENSGNEQVIKSSLKIRKETSQPKCPPEGANAAYEYSVEGFLLD